MRYIFIIIIFLVSAYKTTIAQKKGFELKGNIEGLKDGTLVFLTSRDKDTISSAVSEGQKFILKGHVDGEANFYFLQLDSIAKKPNDTNKSTALWLINSTLSISGGVKDLAKLKLTGSEPQDAWLEFKDLQDKNFNSKEWKTLLKSFIESHLQSLFTPYLLQNFNSLEREEIYSKLSDRAKKTFYGFELSKRIDQEKMYQKITSLGRIPNFKITDPDGKENNIYGLASKSKYTLLDFWASWCGPCRAAIPDLTKTYEAFHSKGFNIIGISTDKKESDWLKALAEDKTPWVHGLDNLENAGKSIFGLLAIPGYILIDQEGKIIQSELMTTLNSSSPQIKKIKNKSLSINLYEIINQLLKDEKNK